MENMTEGKSEKGQMNGKGLQHLNNPLFSFDPNSTLLTNQMRVKIDIVDSIDTDHFIQSFGTKVVL